MGVAMALSEGQLRSIYPNAQADSLRAFAQQNGALLESFGIDRTTDRLSFFLAQIGHECGGLTITHENLNYSAGRLVEVWPSRFPDAAAAAPFAGDPEKLANNVYADRMGNGPSASGDGWRYRGRGYIQITGRDGYQRVGEIIGENLEADPDSVAAPEGALLAVCGFWTWKALNQLSDTGDYVEVTRRINGGTTGMDDRNSWLAKVRQMLAADPARPPDRPPEDVMAVQQALHARGYTEVGGADGAVGRNTVRATVRFRRENSLGVGFIDDALLTALGVATA